MFVYIRIYCFTYQYDNLFFTSFKRFDCEKKYKKNDNIGVILNISRQRGRVVKAPADDQHGLGSKPTRAILLCSWERHFTALSPAC